MSRRPYVATRLARVVAAALSASLLALVVATSAMAVEPVDMGDAHDYSVVASAVTSTGATAMSDNLGSTAPVAGTPIVLGQTHTGAAADAAKASMNLAYADAQLRPSTGAIPANLAGASFGPGVYTATDAIGFTAGGVLTLTGDEDAVFIFQIGAALTVGASAAVSLEGGADPCNVFWQVNGATTIGASAQLAGTFMADADTTVGAGSRIDGRLLSKGAVTLDSNAIRTACTETVLVPGPPGPTGADGADGADGAQGIQGETGATGADGTDGADGNDGADGLNGTAGLNGVQGLTGPTGAGGTDGNDGADGADGLNGTDGVNGVQGLTGPTGADGPVGPAGVAPPADTTTLCVTKKASRRNVHQGESVRWTIVVTNCGERVASGVSVVDRLHTGATFQTRGARAAGRRLRWETATLAPGARKTYRIITRFNARAPFGRYVNSATADADNAQPTTGHGSTTLRPTSDRAYGWFLPGR
jgi:uncharacterized repeat protein (TIGR01451 family)